MSKAIRNPIFASIGAGRSASFGSERWALAEKGAVMRTWMATWTVGAMVAGGAAVSAQEALEARGPFKVTVHVTDYAHLASDHLVDAQAHATAAYRVAGLDLVWSSAPWMSEARQGSGAPSIDVRLVILPHEMTEKKCRAERLGDGTLGVATSATKAHDGIAYVFADRIAHVALSQQTAMERGLAYTMAHEVGHLLLGVNSHADAGLMRPSWNPRETWLQTFTARQVQTIQQRFTTESGLVDERPGLKRMAGPLVASRNPAELVVDEPNELIEGGLFSASPGQE